MQKIDGSSAIEAVEMSGDDLRIHFTSGKAYDYAGVGREKMVEMINSKSAGQFFAQEIKPNHEGVLVPEDTMDITTDDAQT